MKLALSPCLKPSTSPFWTAVPTRRRRADKPMETLVARSRCSRYLRSTSRCLRWQYRTANSSNDALGLSRGDGAPAVGETLRPSGSILGVWRESSPDSPWQQVGGSEISSAPDRVSFSEKLAAVTEHAASSSRRGESHGEGDSTGDGGSAGRRCPSQS